MGTFTFKWAHPEANEVYVRGTFNSWSKSEQLEKKGEVFEKTVTLPDASKKIYYKFVVDGNWLIDPTAPQEHDPEGNMNNFLTPDRITQHTPETAGILSSVAPTSTTHDLAKNVPLENTGSNAVPGAFIETPSSEPAAFSVNPIPATAGTGNPIKLEPGEPVPDPSTLTSNTVSSTVHDDASLARSAEEPEQKFSVDPIPATAGAGNPVNIGAGEPVPSHGEVTGNSIESTVRTDKESYENADASAPFSPPVTTPEAEREGKGTGAFGLPPISNNMIPESSLPMGAAAFGATDISPMIQSAGPESTTAKLAAAVPLEEKKAEVPEPEVPEVVKESQKEADADPEASAVPAEVEEKSEVEKELLSKVPEAPVTSDDTTAAAGSAGTKTEEAGAAVGAAALAVGGAAAAYVASTKDKVTESLGPATTSTPAETATSSATDAKDKVIAATGLGETSNTATTETTPEVVKESIAESGQGAEAAAYAEPVAEKAAVEKELLAEVKTETATGEPAPKLEGAAASPAPAAAALSPPAVESPALQSRDISPTTVPGSHKPAVTTGVAAATTETKSTPSKPTFAPAPDAASASSAAGSSAVGATDKKSKRRSFFGRLKDKLSDKKKE